jgi:hypothetical protein
LQQTNIGETTGPRNVGTALGGPPTSCSCPDDAVLLEPIPRKLGKLIKTNSVIPDGFREGYWRPSQWQSGGPARSWARPATRKRKTWPV